MAGMKLIQQTETLAAFQLSELNASGDGFGLKHELRISPTKRVYLKHPKTGSDHRTPNRKGKKGKHASFDRKKIAELLDELYDYEADDAEFEEYLAETKEECVDVFDADLDEDSHYGHKLCMSF